jgi:hypothetical protein
LLKTGGLTYPGLLKCGGLTLKSTLELKRILEIRRDLTLNSSLGADIRLLKRTGTLVKITGKLLAKLRSSDIGTGKPQGIRGSLLLLVLNQTTDTAGKLLTLP